MKSKLLFFGSSLLSIFIAGFINAFNYDAVYISFTILSIVTLNEIKILKLIIGMLILTVCLGIIFSIILLPFIK